MLLRIDEREASLLIGKLVRGLTIQEVKFPEEGKILLTVKYGFVPVKVGLKLSSVSEDRIELELEGGVAQMASSLNLSGKGWRLEGGKLIVETASLPVPVKIEDIKIADGTLELKASIA